MIPASLASEKVWLAWRWANPPGRDPFKLPVQINGRPASSVDPGTWSNLDAVKAALERNPEWNLALGLGWGRWGIDLDHCVTDGKIDGWAWKIIEEINSYAEFSPSGTGVHILCYGDPARAMTGLSYTLPNQENVPDGQKRKIEIYQNARYLTFTGQPVSEFGPKDLQDRTEAFLALRARVESKRAASHAADSPPRSATKPKVASDADRGTSALEDAQVLELARSSRAADAFNALWDGDASAQAGDHSSADLALCGHLAFWTNCDPEQMDRLFRESGLMRKKWDTRRGLETYGERTVFKAIENCGETYSGGAGADDEEFKERMRAKRKTKKKNAVATSVFTAEISPMSNATAVMPMSTGGAISTFDYAAAAKAVAKTEISQPVDMAETADGQYTGIMVPWPPDDPRRVENRKPESDVEYDKPEEPEPEAEVAAVKEIEDQRSFTSTDLGNMERFRESFGGQLMWSRANGWVRYDGTRWVRGEEYSTRAAQKVARDIVSFSTRADLTPDEAKALAKHGLASMSVGRLHAMTSLAAENDPFTIDESMLDGDPWLFNVPNGTIDLRTGELRPHRAADRITKIGGIDYDPDAKSELWDEIVSTSTEGQKGLAPFLQRASGYTLSGETREDAVFFLHGPGGTSKSTISGALEAVMGTYAKTVRSEALTVAGNSGHNEDIAVLLGARLALTGEADKADRMRDGLFKRLSGGDTISASRKNKPSFEFKPTFKLWFVTNTVPALNPDDSGIWRRVYKLAFIHPVPNPDRSIRPRVTRDPAIMRAVLAWAVAGAVEWYRAGLRPPQSVIAATEELRRSMDGLADFFDERCFFDERASVQSKDIMHAYIEWCDEAGQLRSRATPRGLAFALLARGAQKTHGRSGSIFSGVGLKSDDL